MLHRPNGNGNVADIVKKDVVRFAEPIDENQIRLLLTLAHAENSVFKADINKVEFFMRRFLFTRFLPSNDTGVRGFFGVIGPLGGTLEALTMVSLSCQWYTSEPYLEEYLLYVHPEYRTKLGFDNKGHAAKLIDFLIGLADQMNLPLLTGILSQTRMEAKCRLYRRKFTPIGQFFLHLPKGRPQWESERILSQFRLVQSSSAAA